MKEMRQEFSDTLLEVGVQDKNLIVLVGDISHFRLLPFATSCPGRYYNVGICEPTIVNMAAGLSMLGFYPVVHTIAPFIVERSYEQIKLDLCYQKLGANIITVGSSFDYSFLGCTHHCYTDFALLKPLPDTLIMFPASPLELNTLFKQTYNNRKVNYFRAPKESHGINFKINDIKSGNGIKLKDGSSVTIVVTGPQLKNALMAANHLGDIEVIYVHTIKPLDHNLIASSIRKTKKVLVVEEHSEYGGLGDEIVRVTKDISNIKYDFISIADNFIRDYGSYEDLCETVGFTSENIIVRVRNLVNKREA